MTRRGRGRPTRQVLERDRDSILDVVGKHAQARAQDDPGDGDDVGPGPDRGLERVEPGGLIGGRDRSGRVDGDRGCHGRAGLKERVQGEDGRGPRLRSPDGRTDTGMPVAIRRAIARGPTEAGRRGQQSARSDRSELEALDVISVSPVLDGPFGQDKRYGGRSRWVNGLVHELRQGIRESIHEL